MDIYDRICMYSVWVRFTFTALKQGFSWYGAQRSRIWVSRPQAAWDVTSMYHAQSHHLLLHNIRLQRVSTDFACSFAKGFLITKTSRRTQSWRDLAQIFYWEIWGAQTTLAQSSCTSPGPVHPSQVSQDLYLSRIIRDHSWSRSDFGSSCDPDVLWSIDSLPLSIGGLHNQGHRPPNFQKGTKETMIIALLL